MKKILLLLVCMVASATSYAFSPIYGVKVGVNGTNIINADMYKTMKPSVYAGIYAEILVMDRCIVQPEVVYSRQGAQTSEGSTDMALRLNYLNVPVMFKYQISEQFSILLGPQLGINLNARTTADIGDAGVSLKVTDSFTVCDFAMAAGVEYQLMPILGFSIRYNYGLTDISKGPHKINNSTLQLGINISL